MFRITIKVAKRLAAIFAICTVFASPSLAQGSWVTETPVPTPRPADPAIVIGGKIYVSTTTDMMGFAPVKSSLVVYDPATDTWDSTKTADPLHRGGHGAAAIDGKLYVVGGCLGNGNTGPDCSFTTNALSVYDPALDTWTSLAPMPTARSGSAVAALGGKLYVAGGNVICNAFCPQNDILEIYDPASNTWISSTTLPAQAAPMPETREGMKPAVIGGKLYVVGGLERIHPGAGGSFPIGELWVYDPATNAWDTSKASMPTARTGHAAGAIGGQLYAVGGVFYTLAMQIGVNLDTLERYDPATDTWATLTPMPTERLFHGAAVVGDQLYVMGGGNSSGLSDATEVFTPDDCETPPGLLSWWDGDLVSGGTALDVVGTRDGTLTNGATTAPGQTGTAFSFDGANDYIQLPFTSGIFSAEYTIESWFRPTRQNTLPVNQAIIGNDFASNRGLALLFGVSTREVSCTVQTSVNKFFVTQPGVSLANWHHGACTYDGSTLTLYLEGVPVQSTAASGSVHNNFVPFRIGHDRFDGHPQRYFEGQIDEPAIYDVALTAEQIRAIYNIGANGKCVGQISAPPTANAGPDQTTDEGLMVTLDGSASTNATNYVWSQVAGPTVILSSTTVVNPFLITPYVDINTTLTFQLIVDDGQGNLSDPDTVNITVVSTNSPPVADAGSDGTVKEGAVAALDGTGSFDPESDTPLGYTWTQIGGPVVLLNLTIPELPTFTAPPGVGTLLTFELVVDDGKESGLPDTVIITIVANSAPLADAGVDQTLSEGSPVNLDGTLSSDPDGGDTLSFVWTGAVPLTGANTATPSFIAPDVGAGGAMLAFDVVVTDDDPFSPLSDTDQVIITVQNINDPPRCDLAQAVCFRSSSEKSGKSGKSKKSKKSGKSGKSKSGKRVRRDCGILRRPNHKLVLVKIEGVTDPQSQAVTLLVTGVTQDEPTSGLGHGDSSPDAVLQGDSVLLRRERDKNGNGRVYNVNFTATDVSGASCAGSLTLSVPRKKKDPAIDDGQIFDSTQP